MPVMRKTKQGNGHQPATPPTPTPESAEEFVEKAFPNEFTGAGAEPVTTPDDVLLQVLSAEDEEDGSNIPASRYEAVLTYAVLRRVGEAGSSVLMEFVVANPDYANKKLKAWFTLVDRNGQPGHEFQVKLFKATFARLGYKLDPRALQADLKELSTEKPGVLLVVKYSKDENHYQNVIVERRVDTEHTNELREALGLRAANRPF